MENNERIFYELVDEYKQAEKKWLDTKWIANAIQAILDYELCGRIVQNNPS